LGICGVKIENIADISVSPIFSVQKYRYRIDLKKKWYQPISSKHVQIGVKSWSSFYKVVQLHKPCWVG